MGSERSLSTNLILGDNRHDPNPKVIVVEMEMILLVMLLKLVVEVEMEEEVVKANFLVK